MSQETGIRKNIGEEWKSLGDIRNMKLNKEDLVINIYRSVTGDPVGVRILNKSNGLIVQASGPSKSIAKALAMQLMRKHMENEDESQDKDEHKLQARR